MSSPSEPKNTITLSVTLFKRYSWISLIINFISCIYSQNANVGENKEYDKITSIAVECFWLAEDILFTELFYLEAT